MPADSSGRCNKFGESLDGFINPSRLRGRSLRLRAMVSRSALVSSESSVLLGMYWRSKPLVFSLVALYQGLWGSQK